MQDICDEKDGNEEYMAKTYTFDELQFGLFSLAQRSLSLNLPNIFLYIISGFISHPELSDVGKSTHTASNRF